MTVILRLVPHGHSLRMTRRNPYLQKLSNKIIEYRGCGGSDFHGGNKPDIALGTGRGSLAVPTALYRTLAERVK